jgi:hypothetical protein
VNLPQACLPAPTRDCSRDRDGAVAYHYVLDVGVVLRGYAGQCAFHKQVPAFPRRRNDRHQRTIHAGSCLLAGHRPAGGRKFIRGQRFTQPRMPEFLCGTGNSARGDPVGSAGRAGPRSGWRYDRRTLEVRIDEVAVHEVVMILARIMGHTGLTQVRALMRRYRVDALGH